MGNERKIIEMKDRLAGNSLIVVILSVLFITSEKSLKDKIERSIVEKSFFDS